MSSRAGGVPAGVDSYWAGPTAATCGSTTAGPGPWRRATRQRRNWPRSRRTSFWCTGTAPLAPLLQATRTLPIVFVIVIDPVGAGFVASLARPGGNATGFTLFEYGMSGKWLELLKQIAPGVTRAAVLRDPDHHLRHRRSLPRSSRQRPPSVGGVSPLDVRDRRRDRARRHRIRALPQWRPDRHARARRRSRHRDLIVALAARHRLPAIYPLPPLVVSRRADVLRH